MKSPSATSNSLPKSGGKTLLAGGLAALLASTCCLGPLALMMVGVSGSWISHLAAMEPYQPLFIAVALVALFSAARKIWKPAAACAPDQVCVISSVTRAYKALFGIVVLLLIATMGFPLIAHWFY